MSVFFNFLLGPFGFLCLFFLFISHWIKLAKGAGGKELKPILGAAGKYFFVYHLFLFFGPKM